MHNCEIRCFTEHVHVVNKTTSLKNLFLCTLYTINELDTIPNATFMTVLGIPYYVYCKLENLLAVNHFKISRNINFAFFTVYAYYNCLSHIFIIISNCESMKFFKFTVRM